MNKKIIFILAILLPSSLYASFTGSSCTFAPTASFGNTLAWGNVTCSSSEWTINFWQSNTVGWSYWANVSLTSMNSQNYGPVGYAYFTWCSGVASNQAGTGTCSTFLILSDYSAIIRSWPTWATWATWATWPQGIQGEAGQQWPSWLSAYELALAFWFTGTEIEWIQSLQWPVWSTGSLDFSTLSGTINLQNVVNIPDNEATLEADGFYFAITRERDGVTYIDWIWVRNILFVLVVAWLIIKWIRYFLSTKNNIIW